MSDVQAFMVVMGFIVVAIFFIAVCYELHWLGRSVKAINEDRADHQIEHGRVACGISDAIQRLDDVDKQLHATDEILSIHGLSSIRLDRKEGWELKIDLRKLSFTVEALLRHLGYSVKPVVQKPVTDRWELVKDEKAKEGGAA